MLVYGVESMKLMKLSRVLISGLSGVGVEVAKNIALAGVRSLTLHDRRAAQWTDLAAQCYLTESDVVGHVNRTTASAPRVQQLNPAVRVVADSSTDVMAEATATTDDGRSFFDEFDCVIVCDQSLAVQLAVNEACRRSSTGPRFLSVCNRGAFGWAFADFGSGFMCLDQTGEPPVEVALGSVSWDERGLCQTLDKARHDLENGDVVRFRELTALPGLNGQERQVRVVSPTEFEVGDTRACGPGPAGDTRCGQAVQVIQPLRMSFRSLQDQLDRPDVLPADFAKLERPQHMHVALQALEQFALARRRSAGMTRTGPETDVDFELPRPWNQDDANELVALSRAMMADGSELDETAVRQLAYTARGSFCPLASFLGGVVAQESLKALSGKFKPLQQWLHIDCTEVIPRIHDNSSIGEFDFKTAAEAERECGARGDRLDGQRIVLGDAICRRLASQRLFMVGSGAIGCELLKCFALMGVCSAAPGRLLVTDPDHVEKSNLNRQFLFRAADIGQPKSERAAAAARALNQAFIVDPALDRVGPDTEHKYSDQFFHQLDCVVNALDNVQARLYVDARCVANQKPLLESGTLGTKGHVQVIVPHLTESYSSQRDPPEKDVPFCKMVHAIEWARDFAFGGYFVAKPDQFNCLYDEPNLAARLRQFIESNGQLNGAADGDSLDLKVVRVVAKLLAMEPQSPAECIAFARQRFEAYFRNKALQLLHTFPLDHTVDEQGTRFWLAPKRPPTPIQFDWADPVHRGFVVNCARLWARVWGLHGLMDQCTDDQFREWTEQAEARLPPFVAKSNKHIETDESKTADSAAAAAAAATTTTTRASAVDETKMVDWAKIVLQDVDQNLARRRQPDGRLDVAQFEKDDDSNHHVDYMAAAANLRARMYGIEEGDRLRVKSIAGRIMPAIATTTASVSGLVALELVKIARGDLALADYKNLFMNLALPFFTLTEPRACQRQRITDQISTTIWDSWDVRGKRTLKDLVQYFDDRFRLTVQGVTHGARLVYMKALPAHKKRLLKSVRALVKDVEADARFIDLTVAFLDSAGNELANPPSIRFYFDDDDDVDAAE